MRATWVWNQSLGSHRSAQQLDAKRYRDASGAACCLGGNSNTISARTTWVTGAIHATTNEAKGTRIFCETDVMALEVNFYRDNLRVFRSTS